MMTITRTEGGYMLGDHFVPEWRVKSVQSQLTGNTLHYLMDGSGSWVPVYIDEEEDE